MSTMSANLAIFQRILRARDQGKNFILGRHGEEHEYVLACDMFREVRLNMHAIGLTVEGMRQIERCGVFSHAGTRIPRLHGCASGNRRNGMTLLTVPHCSVTNAVSPDGATSPDVAPLVVSREHLALCVVRI